MEAGDSIEVRAEEWALAAFREAMQALQKRSDHRLNDDEALLSMVREILGGPRDPGRASYQIVVIQCEDCGRGFQHASGEQIALDPAIVEMCHCDAQSIAIPITAAPSDTQRIPIAPSDTQRIPIAAAPSDTQRIPIATAPSDTVDPAHMSAADRLEASKATAGHAHMRAADGLGASTGTALESAPSTRTAPESAAHRPKCAASAGRGGLKRARATQDTPPAIRREVFWRDRGRCIVPGCRNAAYVDRHHLDLRAEGGGNDPENLVVLCGAHHGALHRGRLRTDGKVSTGLRVRHADGTAYGFMPSPTLAEASATAFAALRNLSFSEKTARAALERALATAPANASKATLLRAALAHATHREPNRG